MQIYYFLSNLYFYSKEIPNLFRKHVPNFSIQLIFKPFFKMLEL